MKTPPPEREGVTSELVYCDEFMNVIRRESVAAAPSLITNGVMGARFVGVVTTLPSASTSITFSSRLAMERLRNYPLEAGEDDRPS